MEDNDYKVECAPFYMLNGLIDEEKIDGWEPENLDCTERVGELYCCILFKKKA